MAGGGGGEAGLGAAVAGVVKGAAGFGAAAVDEVKGAAGLGVAGGGETAAGLEAAAGGDGGGGGDEVAGFDAIAEVGAGDAEGLEAIDAGEEPGFGGVGGADGGANFAAPPDGASSVTISVRSSTSSSSLSAEVRAFRSGAFGLLTGLVSLSSFSDMIRRMEDRISSIVGS
jgi:hypothetical protein